MRAPVAQIKDRRRAATRAIDRFCAQEGIADPRLRARRRDGVACIIGTAPDGREFGVGYQVKA